MVLTETGSLGPFVAILSRLPTCTIDTMYQDKTRVDKTRFFSKNLALDKTRMTSACHLSDKSLQAKS